MVVWQFTDDTGRWRNMRASDAGVLEHAFRRDYQAKVEIPLGPYHFRYVVDFGTMCQTNQRTGCYRQMRRLEASYASSAGTQTEKSSFLDTTVSTGLGQTQVSDARPGSRAVTPERSALDHSMSLSPQDMSRSGSLKRCNRSCASIRSEPRTPGPATYDISNLKRSLTPRSAVFGSMRRTHSAGSNNSGSKENSAGPGPTDYDVVAAWARSSNSISGGDATIGRTVRLTGHYLRTPTEANPTSDNSLSPLEASPFFSVGYEISPPNARYDMRGFLREAEGPTSCRLAAGELGISESALDLIENSFQMSLRRQRPAASDLSMCRGKARPSSCRFTAPRGAGQRPQSLPPERTL